jgi:hypothetical protein
MKRLDRLEAIMPNVAHDLSAYKLKTALIAIVAVHAGQWSGKGSPAEAVARALGMTPVEMKGALSDNHGDLWSKIMRTLDSLVVARGGRLFEGDEFNPLAEAREALDYLFNEVRQQLKAHMGLFPNFADYFL